MNEQRIDRGRSVLRLALPILGILLPLVASRAQAATCSNASELSNLELLGAMPVEAEAALIIRVHELDRPSSLLTRWVQYVGDPEAESDLGYDGEPDVPLMLENAIARAGLHTIVWAGSRFVEPVGIGASRFDMRKVFITQTGLAPLEQSLRAEAARSSLIEYVASGDFRYFKMRLSKQSGSEGVQVPGEYFLSFLDPCTVVLAETTEEIASLTRALKNPNRSGDLVTLASGVAADAPIYLVRNVKPPNDCQSALAACTEAPGLGRPCDQCPAARSPTPPVLVPPGEGILPS